MCRGKDFQMQQQIQKGQDGNKLDTYEEQQENQYGQTKGESRTVIRAKS